MGAQEVGGVSRGLVRLFSEFVSAPFLLVPQFAVASDLDPKMSMLLRKVGSMGAYTYCIGWKKVGCTSAGNCCWYKIWGCIWN